VLRGCATLLGFQLAGEVLAQALRLPVPGPVVGMALLLAALQLRPPGEGLRAFSSGLLSHLSLLFVPAGVGIVLHAPRLAAEWPALVASLVLSAAATLVVTGWLVQRLSPRAGGEEGR
jgi:holin-like protein